MPTERASKTSLHAENNQAAAECDRDMRIDGREIMADVVVRLVSFTNHKLVYE